MGHNIKSLYMVLLLACGLQYYNSVWTCTEYCEYDLCFGSGYYVSIYGPVPSTVNIVSATVQGKLR